MKSFFVQKPERRNNWRRSYVGRRANRPKTCYRQSEGKSIEMRKIRKFTKRVNVKAVGDLGKTRKRIVWVLQKSSYKENQKVNQWSCERNQRVWNQQPIQSSPSLDCRSLSWEKMERTWLTSEIESEEGRETEIVSFLFGHWYNKKVHFSVSENRKFKFVFCVSKLKLKNRLRKVDCDEKWRCSRLENQATDPEDSTRKFWKIWKIRPYMKFCE
jgi:hypothetical protein